MLPYHVDALQAPPKRYASARFRRVARVIRTDLLDYSDVVELVAFVESVGGFRYARWIFHWGYGQAHVYAALREHAGRVGEDCARDNLAAFGVDEGLAVLHAMQEGGWRHGSVPWCVQMALKELRKRGKTLQSIADATGLTFTQVQRMTGRSRRSKSRENAAFAALAL